MITMLNTSNKIQSIVLEEAWKYLSDKGLLEQADIDSATNGKNTFTNLAHYFHYLPELINYKAKYLMLPTDEEAFYINANTRTIDVPPAFSACGGVKSDNYAEIITFKIDRYFDYKDLAEANIAVQWKNAAGKEGVSFIDLIDLETEGDKGLLRFGWPLTAEMTAAAGPLYFAVRFYTADTREGAVNLAYLFNTTPKFIEIKDTLSIDFNDIDVVKNTADIAFFLNTVTRSQNPSYRIPSNVVFSDVPDSVAAIRLSDNQLELEAEAYTSDGNHIDYEWYYMAPGYTEYAPENWPDKRPAIDLFVVNDKYAEGSDEPQYIKYVDAWPATNPNNLYAYNQIHKLVDNDKFEIVKGEDCYKPYNPTSWPESRPGETCFWKENGTGGYEKYPLSAQWPIYVANQEAKDRLVEENNGEDVLTTLDITLYTKKTILKFKPSNEKVTGAYFVRGINQSTDLDGITVINSVHTDAPAGYCWILTPEQVEIVSKDKDLPDLTFAGEDEANTLTVTVNTDDANPQRFYNVYYAETKEVVENKTEGAVTILNGNNPIELTESNSKVTKDGIEITYNIPTITSGVEPNVVTSYKFGYYAIEPIVKLNRDESDVLSNVCLVSDLPGEVTGHMEIFGQAIPTGSSDGVITNTNPGAGEASAVRYRWVEDQKGDPVDYDTVRLGANDLTDEDPDFDGLDIGDIFVLSVPYEITNQTTWNTGDIIYEWKRQVPDRAEEDITDEYASIDGDVVGLTDDNELKVKWVGDSLSGVRYTCQITNQIGNKSETSKSFTFILT